jgi:hypothetical protein
MIVVCLKNTQPPPLQSLNTTPEGNSAESTISTTREAIAVCAITLGAGKKSNADRLDFAQPRVYYQTMIPIELLVIFSVFAFFMLLLFVGDYFGADPYLMVVLGVVLFILGYGVYSLVMLFT